MAWNGVIPHQTYPSMQSVQSVLFQLVDNMPMFVGYSGTFQDLFFFKNWIAMYIWRFPEMGVPPNHGFHFWVSFLEPPYTPYITFSLTGLSMFTSWLLTRQQSQEMWSKARWKRHRRRRFTGSPSENWADSTIWIEFLLATRTKIRKAKTC